nr:hypothetical protein C1892_21695 [Pseudomonas sp. MPBD7-1]
MHTPEIKNCGSELARDGGVSATSMLTDPPLSRASSLPQCSVVEVIAPSTPPHLEPAAAY